MRVLSILLIVLALPALSQAAEVEGKLVWYKLFPVKSLLSGRVDQLNVKAGQQVDKGQLLLSIDKEYHRQSVLSAQASIEKARAEADEARRELERTQSLYEQTLIAKHEFDLVKVADQQAQASLQLAQAELQQAKLNMAQSEIEAPFAARVLAVNVQLQQTVNNRWQSQPMMWLASREAMLVQAPLSAPQAQALEAVSRLAVRVGKKTYQGKLEGISYTEQDGYQLNIRLSSPSSSLVAGIRAIVELP